MNARHTLTSTILARFLAMVPDELSFPPLSNLTSTLRHCLPIVFTTFPCSCKLRARVLCLTTTLESSRIRIYHAPYKDHNSTNAYNIEHTSFNCYHIYGIKQIFFPTAWIRITIDRFDFLSNTNPSSIGGMWTITLSCSWSCAEIILSNTSSKWAP